MKSYASHVVKAQEEERGRLARELHDDTMQNLLLISNRLKEIDVGTYGQLPSQVRGQMEKLREFTEQTMGSVRRFTLDLRPLMLDDMGLVPTLEWLIARLKDEFRIEADVKIIGKERRLNPDTEFALFRIVQEALNNIRKHANASVVNAVLEFCHESIRMIVYDNGQGFEVPDIPTHFARQGKLGIAGISERVRLLGGTFEVDSQPGGGTTLKVEIQG